MFALSVNGFQKYFHIEEETGDSGGQPVIRRIRDETWGGEKLD